MVVRVSNTCRRDLSPFIFFFPRTLPRLSPRRASARYVGERNQSVRCTHVRDKEIREERVVRQRCITLREAQNARGAYDAFEPTDSTATATGSPGPYGGPTPGSVPVSEVCRARTNQRVVSVHPRQTRSVSSDRWRRWRERSCAIEIRAWRQRAIYRSNGSAVHSRCWELRAPREAGSAAFFNFRYLIGIDCVLNSTLYIICELSYMYKIIFPIFYVNLLSKLCKFVIQVM